MLGMMLLGLAAVVLQLGIVTLLLAAQKNYGVLVTGAVVLVFIVTTLLAIALVLAGLLMGSPPT